jgi:hypothetical protein
MVYPTVFGMLRAVAPDFINNILQFMTKELSVGLG